MSLNPTVSDCLFCRIVAVEIPADVVTQTDRVLAFRDIVPLAPVHVLVVPKQHYEDAAELAAAGEGLTDELVSVAAEVAAGQGIVDSGYRLVFNTGPDAGRTVFHAHLHLLGGSRLHAIGVA